MPQELIDAIVDQLIFERATLVACSLLSHSWRAPSLRLLFTALCIDGAPSGHKFKAFADFMAESPQLARHVEELELNDRSFNRLDLDILVDMLAVLPRLRVLRLDLVKLWGKEAPIIQTFPLEHLVLCTVAGHAGKCTILDVLRLFPDLRHLKLHSVRKFLPRIGSDILHTAPWLEVPELTLYELVNDHIYIWLCSSIAACTTLRIAITKSTELRTFFRQISASLQYLEVVLWDSEVGFAVSGKFRANCTRKGTQAPLATVIDELHLEACLALRSCTLYLGLILAFQETGGWLHFLQRLPRTLGRITIEFHDRAQADSFDATQLEPILARFSELESITFRYHYPDAFLDYCRPRLEAAVKERLARVLPALHRCHALRWDGDDLGHSPMEGRTPLLMRSKSSTCPVCGVCSS